jgi:hypothetical protein
MLFTRTAPVSPRPEPPPVVKAAERATENRRDAYERGVMGGYSHIPIDPEALIEEGCWRPCLVCLVRHVGSRVFLGGVRRVCSVFRHVSYGRHHLGV